MVLQDFFIRFVDLLFTVLFFAVIVRVLLSWVPIPQDNPLVRFLIEITEPILQPLKRVIPPIGMIDISPVIALFLLEIFHQIIRSSLGYR